MADKELRNQLEAKGFSKIEKIFSPSELDDCEEKLTTLMFKRSYSVKPFKKDMSAQSDDRSDQIEILRPSLLCNSLRSSILFKRCHAIASNYFACNAHYLFDHAIFKMPGSMTITPWHQDQAYLDPDIIIPSLHFWIPFQDTTAMNGAMQFAPARYLKLQPHTQAYPHNSRILKVINSPTEHIHTMDICRGDISIHTNLTLHSATQNQSDSVRKAWIIHFGAHPDWYKQWLRIKSKAAKIFNIKPHQKVGD